MIIIHQNYVLVFLNSRAISTFARPNTIQRCLEGIVIARSVCCAIGNLLCSRDNRLMLLLPSITQELFVTITDLFCLFTAGSVYSVYTAPFVRTIDLPRTQEGKYYHSLCHLSVTHWFQIYCHNTQISSTSPCVKNNATIWFSKYLNPDFYSLSSSSWLCIVKRRHLLCPRRIRRRVRLQTLPLWNISVSSSKNNPLGAFFPTPW